MRMKFFYQFIILASILFFVSCLSRRTNLSTYPNANPNPTTNTTLDTENISSENQEEITDSVIEYVKSFKIITGQNYHRSVQLYYYGLKSQLQETLVKYDPKKGVNILLYKKFPKASFYAGDTYKIPEEKREQAVSVFAPLLDSLVKKNRNGSIFRAEIVVFGYTDEETIDTNTENYQQLLLSAQQKSMTENEYINYLSYLRAMEVGDIINEQLAAEFAQFNQNAKAIINVIVEGRGIEYPDPTRDYKSVDDKRKITKVYWKVY